MENNEILFAKVRDSAQIPSKSAENAGYDIYACFDEDFVRIPAHTTELIPTGVASALPLKYYFQIEERGSTGSKGMKKSAGVIDSGYRGEWFIAITNTNNNDLYIAKKHFAAKLEGAAIILGVEIMIHPYEKAIAQAVLQEVPSVIELEVDYEELKQIKSERGTGALGSSGK